MSRSMPIWAAITLSILARPSPADEGPPRSRTFEVTYRATVRDIPEGAKALDLWLPVPADRPEPDDPPPHDRRPRPRDHRPGAPARQPVPPRPGRVGPGRPVAVTLTIVATRRENAGSGEPLERRGAGSLPGRRAAGPPGRPRPGSSPWRRPGAWPPTPRRPGRSTRRSSGMMRYDKSGTGWGRGTPCSPAMRGGATAPTSTP